MSLKYMLEIAKTQNSVESLADALTISLDASSLSSSSDILNPNAVRIVIDHATPEEAVALVNNHLDMAGGEQFDLLVCEAMDGNGAIVIFNDPDEVVTAQLEEAHVIMELAERRERPIADAEDDEDDPHTPEDDTDVDPDGDEDEEDAEGDDPNAMRILHDDEGFKLATRLQAMACGPSKTYFPHFVHELDKFLIKMRNKSGYDPSVNPEQASAEVADMLELATAMFVEEAKKGGKKFKQGRGGFLSAYMSIIAKNSDKLVESWDALDVAGMEAGLGEVGAMLCDQMDEERVKQGLEPAGPTFVDGKPVEKEDVEGDEAIARVVNK